MWQPIETAPTELSGQHVLVLLPATEERHEGYAWYYLDGTAVAWAWHVPFLGWKSPSFDGPVTVHPTHWHPLPAPPEARP